MKPKQISKSIENIALFMTERFLTIWYGNNEKITDIYTDELTMQIKYLFRTKIYTIQSKNFDLFVRKTKNILFAMVFAYHPPKECWIRECPKIKGTIKNGGKLYYNAGYKPTSKKEEKTLFQAFDELENLIKTYYKGYGDIID